MKSNQKFQLLFIDRLGIVSDVATILVDHGLNILSMEVQVKGKFVFVYLETEYEHLQFDQESFFASLKKISGWRETRSIYNMPHEKKVAAEVYELRRTKRIIAPVLASP